jgi:hypothetical protein
LVKKQKRQRKSHMGRPTCKLNYDNNKTGFVQTDYENENSSIHDPTVCICVDGFLRDKFFNQLRH